MKKRARKNPVPPGAKFRSNSIVGVIRHARNRVEPRRLAWALLAVLEEVYRELELRGIFMDDRFEAAASAIRRWAIDGRQVMPEDIGEAFELMNETRRDVIAAQSSATKYELDLATSRMVLSEGIYHLTGYSFFATKKFPERAVEVANLAYVALLVAEPDAAAARARILGLLRATLEVP